MRGEGPPKDKSIDVHFRSGAYLGVGISHVIIILMPARLVATLVSLVELFGYKGNSHLGVSLLQVAAVSSKVHR